MLSCEHWHAQLEDDDDLDEEAIPGFTHPGLVPSPHSPGQDKGKARAPEQLAPPGSSSLSGNIGTPVNGSAPPPSNRRSVGGVQVETRYVLQTLMIRRHESDGERAGSYTGTDTLDEPIATTIVSYSTSAPTRVAHAICQGRDLLSIYTKLIQVLYPPRDSGNRDLLRCGAHAVVWNNPH